MMAWAVVAEQVLNGLQLGVMLFLIAAGLTLVFGIMDVINLAHGSFFMLGAFFAATLSQALGNFPAAVLLGAAGAGLVGLLVEMGAIRALYRRDHLDQVLATFGLILFFNELVKLIWGPVPIFLDPPAALAGTVDLFGVPYPAFRLALIGCGLAAALFLWWLITRTRLGMLIRAGASNPEMVAALGVDIRLLFTLVFGIGAALAGLAGAMAGPVLSVQIGMGEEILIPAFVVVVIGGIGSVRGAMAGAVLVGVVDTGGRVLLPPLFGLLFDPATAIGVAGPVANMAIYLLMAGVLAFRPRGLFPAGA